MPPNSNTSYDQGHKSPGGDENSPPQGSSKNTPPDTIQNAFESNLAAFASNERPATYRISSIATRSGTVPILPSPRAPLFIPGAMNKTPQSEALNNINGKGNTRKPQKEEQEPELEVEEMASKIEAIGTPPASSDGSVGSWTDDEKFITHFKD